MPRKISRPTLTSVPTIAAPGPNGTTANVTSAGITASIGASAKRIWFASAGMNSSLKKSFSTSAIGCSSPSGPTRLGPMRACMWPAILRSA